VRVDELAEKHGEFADLYYRKPDGTPTREALNCACAFGHLVEVAGAIEVDDLCPRILKQARSAMIESGLARSTINARVNRIRRVIRWAVQEELADVAVLVRLQTVRPLLVGRSAAVEAAGIHEVSEAVVEATLPALSDCVSAMVRVQLFTGMRSGELCIMRPVDLDRSDKVWIYRPTHHKTKHLGKSRFIALGPRAQAVIDPWLTWSGYPFLFPTAAEHRWLWLNSRGNRWTSNTYRQAVVRGCYAAGIRGRDHWTPLQLRHTAATKLAKMIGVESARACLGHASLSTTGIYVERDEQAAVDAMGLLG